MSAETVPIVIVGAGPVGTVLALELARHGVRSVLIDKHARPSPHPKMDYLNGRSMELLRRLGVVEEIRARGVGAEHAFTFIWSRSFLEPPLATWEYLSVAEVRARIAETNDGTSPLEPYQRLPGNVLEELLRAEAARTPLVDLRLGTALTGLEDTGEEVVATLVTDGGESRMRARYLVGCDGAGSTVREKAQIALSRSGPAEEFLDVYFRSSDPALRRHGRFFLAIVAGGITLVSRDERDTWTGFFPVFEASDADDPVATMRRRLGVDFAVDACMNVARWRGSMAVAEAYRRGSVFLAGDAAHQFYPTGGHGANTGIGDAADLGWKLAAVLNGWAGAGALDSYEAERRPVALFNREMCHNLLEVWRRFPQLAADGASREHLAGFLEQDRYQIENLGIYFDYRYTGSPIVASERGRPPAWSWRGITPTTWPGSRVPSVVLDEGSAIFDRLGPGFTLVDFTPGGDGAGVLDGAAARGMPVTHLRIDDKNAREVWGHDLVLVRPDQHSAWRGDVPPADWGPLLDRVRGF
ncbi:FAD-dependent monooxygenase [Nonomuraea typhae]|uniref:FAD-dependent monooxygenase n=1 Tax=Nonomuraea typhae TaxID=2603600 RepID=A0ABW7YU81_9ACTN